MPGLSPHPEVLLVLFASGFAYWWATTHVAQATRRQRGWFAAGLLLLLVAASSPVHDIAEDRLYVVHMVQHVVFTFIAPPMLLLGIPTRLTSWIVGHHPVGAVVRVCTRPLVALIGFNLLVGLSHLEPVVDRATVSEPLHFLLHLVLFSSALCLWCPLINRAPELIRMRSGGKILYLMANALLPVPIVTALALAARPVYAHYAVAPRLWGISALDDQQLAAGVMWLLESFWTIGALAVVFFSWWANEQRNPETASLPDHIRHRRPAPAGG